MLPLEVSDMHVHQLCIFRWWLQCQDCDNSRQECPVTESATLVACYKKSEVLLLAVLGPCVQQTFSVPVVSTTGA
jgi:hypothetical protein